MSSRDSVLDLLGLVKTSIEEAGCHFLGIAPLGPNAEAYGHYEKWIEDSFHASMKWMENYRDQRHNPAQLEAGCTHAILIGIPYVGHGDYLSKMFQKVCEPRVAAYACYEDYHAFARRTGSRLCQTIAGALDKEGRHKWRAVADSIPILERSIHAAYGGGFIGKNTMFIHPMLGSWMLLMEIMTSFPFPPIDTTTQQFLPAVTKGCGGCRRCQTYCPTGALSQEFRLDARRCLSYLSIEHRGVVPLEFWPHFAKFWYGCDVCQMVCPHNRPVPAESVSSVEAPSHGLKPRPEVNRDLFEVALMTQARYETWFGGTPMTRAKRTGLRRNAIMALVARGDLRLSQLQEALKEEVDPVLRETLSLASHFCNSNLFPKLRIPPTTV